MDHDTRMRAPTLTGLVLASEGGERLLARCLASLAFCETRLVVDCSQDARIADIAREAGGRVLFRSWEGFASQFQFAAEQVDTDWFFILDQDELCTPLLAHSIREAIRTAAPDGNVAAYSVARRSWYFNRFMRHGGWAPDHIPRVFRTGTVRFSQDAHIHYHPQGRKAHLAQGEIIHYPYAGFAHQLTKLNQYADQGAAALKAAGNPGGVLRGLGHGAARFFRLYIQKRGFLDGRAGFLAAAHGSFYAFLKYVRVLDASWGKPFDYR
jgi:hypothetical protein